MITVILLLFPVLACLLTLAFPPAKAKYAALTFSVVELLLVGYAWINALPTGEYQFLADIPWVSSLGISFKLGMDGISLMMVLLTALLVPLVVLSTFQREIRKPAIFYALILFMQAGLTGVFVALDAFLFYIAWEAALIPIYFIAALWGGENRVKATFKFLIYTIAGSFFMLVGIIYLYLQTPGSHTFDITAFYALNLDYQQQVWVFFAFFIAFAIKMPLFPFHTWQPDTYAAAPTAGTMLLAAIMLKMGIYGVIRWILPVVPAAVFNWADVIITLAVTGIIYASVIAFRQKDIKRLIAYSSIAHVGLIAAGLFTLNEQAMQGAMIQMLNHGINVLGLFFIVDIVFNRTGTYDRAALGGIVHQAPVLAVCFMIVLLGSVALPLTNGFVGEFLLLSGIFSYSVLFAVLAGLTVIFSSVYMFRLYKDSMLGISNDITSGFRDIRGSERIVLFVVAGLVILIGVYPAPLLSLTEHSVSLLLDQVNAKLVNFQMLSDNLLP
ncbi:NADH dehydrogenase subunit M [Anseongella ginsenosidimutans]|uniref:NADH dehydrogenase subunit M n=1 Tax=Anseongella ginsenosidimutans TaxID=496056 RepID=A0A4R3KUH1_9SPHI|nr:NADH-quinone oxidoreductase subunit M [Anseongella ginsenosidimutans]QEC51698.1 NADH-quinone oxidoreductase subunit M [Anseongella ginsenosidimutans]TCS89057.1 NADH dehydrogenase subunit M [Anseongella ginsenosidimutans]